MDRAAVFTAAYRIAFYGWTPQQAPAEMHEFHFHGFWHPAMTKYAQEFPTRLASSPALAALSGMVQRREIALEFARQGQRRRLRPDN